MNNTFVKKASYCHLSICFNVKIVRGGGGIAQWIAYLLPDPTVLGLNHGSEVFSEKISDAAMLIDIALLSLSGQCKSK